MALTRFRWIMPGAAKVQQAMRAIQFSEVPPKWLGIVGRPNVMISGGRLHVMMLPVHTRKEVVAKVKQEYYSAAGASVPKAIYAKLSTQVANVSSGRYAGSSRASRRTS